MSVSAIRTRTADPAEAHYIFPETEYHPVHGSDFEIDVHSVVTDQFRADHFRTFGAYRSEYEPSSGQLLVIAGEGVAGWTVDGHRVPASTVSLWPATTFFSNKARDTEYHVVLGPRNFMDCEIGTPRDLKPSHADYSRVTWLLTRLHDLAEEEGTKVEQILAASESIADTLHLIVERAEPSPPIVDRDAAYDIVTAAVAAIREQQATSIADITRAVAASRSNLYRSFDAVLGISPYAYMQRRRLTRLRSRLLEVDDQPGVVTREAANLGAYHLGNMAHHYREIFGELPSETAKRRLSVPSNDRIWDEAG